MKPFLPAPLIVCLYCAAACAITYPAVTVIATDFIGHPFGDHTEYAAHIGWILHALRSGQNPFFQPLLLYPEGLSAAWLWAVPLQSFPALAVSLILPLDQPIPLAFNLTLLVTLAVNGWSLYRFALYLTGNGAASFTAGLLYMSLPVVQGHIGAAHIGLLMLWPVPLYAWALMRWIDTARRRDLALAGVCFALSGLGSPVMLIYFTLPVTLILLIHAHGRHRLVHALVPLVVGGALLLPFILPYLIETQRSPSILNSGDSIRYSASLLGIVAPSSQHPLYGTLEYPARVVGGELVENSAYLGVFTAVFALVGLVTVRRVRPWGMLALTAWVLSLGVFLKIDATTAIVTVGGRVTPVTLPYALIADLPFVDLSRTPSRFNFAVGFAAAVMAAYGLARLWPHVKPAALPITAVLAVLIMFDHQVWWDMPTTPAILPAAIHDLGAQPVRAVFNVPFAHPIVDKEAIYLQTAHQLPILGGHIARETPLDPAKGTLLESTLDPALLDAAGVEVIILHRQWDDPAGELEARLRARFGEPSYADEQYAIYRVPTYSGSPPTLVWLHAPILADQHRVYAYVPVDGAFLLTGMVTGDSGRGARLDVDGIPALEWAIPTITDGSAHGLRVPLTLTAGYHTITLNGDPRCGVIPAPMLTCRRIDAQLSLAPA
ncbi:MAG: hypothetical protein SF162_06365 [bacterium]|nr:hypothetical protein [bacterium]